MTDKFTTTRDLDGLVLTFEWHGGEYIDISAAHVGHASEVINVWDSYGDKSRVAHTQEAFEAKVDEWIAEYPRDALIHDATVNWS